MSETAEQQLNEPVPLAFTRALLVQARAYGLDVPHLLESADFPFDPTASDAEPAFVSVEQYGRLCTALFRAIGDEAGGVIAGSATPFGTTRLLLFSILHCPNLGSAMERAMEFNACCRERQGEVRVNDLQVDPDSRLATLRYYSAADVIAPPPQEGVLCSLSMWLRLCGWLIGQTIDVVSATCVGPGNV